MNRYYLIINVSIAGGVAAWLLAAAALVSFEPGFEWKYRDNAIPNFIFLLATAVVLCAVGFVLLRRHVRHGKDSALLLATFNILLAATSFLEGSGNFYRFTTIFNDTVENLVFVLFAWSLIFLLLFLQDVFTGSFKFADHRASHASFVVMAATGIVALALDGLGVRVPALTFAGYACLGVAFLVLTCWQAVAAFRLVGKASEPTARAGLVMIGSSGLLLIVMVVLVVAKSFIDLDLVIPLVAFAASLVGYLGYVHPSRGKKEETAPAA